MRQIQPLCNLLPSLASLSQASLEGIFYLNCICHQSHRRPGCWWPALPGPPCSPTPPSPQQTPRPHSSPTRPHRACTALSYPCRTLGPISLRAVALRVKEQWCSGVFRNSFFHYPAVPRDLIGSNRHTRMLSAPFFIFGVPLILATEAQKGPKIT